MLRDHEFVNAVHRPAHLPRRRCELLEAGSRRTTVLRWWGLRDPVRRMYNRRPPSWSPKANCATAGPRLRISTRRRRRTWRVPVARGGSALVLDVGPRRAIGHVVRACLSQTPSRTWRPSGDATSGRVPAWRSGAGQCVRGTSERRTWTPAAGRRAARDRGTSPARQALHLAGDQHLGSTLRRGRRLRRRGRRARVACGRLRPRRWYPTPRTTAGRRAPGGARLSAASSTAGNRMTVLGGEPARAASAGATPRPWSWLWSGEGPPAESGGGADARELGTAWIHGTGCRALRGVAGRRPVGPLGVEGDARTPPILPQLSLDTPGQLATLPPSRRGCGSIG